MSIGGRSIWVSIIFFGRTLVGVALIWLKADLAECEWVWMNPTVFVNFVWVVWDFRG